VNPVRLTPEVIRGMGSETGSDTYTAILVCQDPDKMAVLAGAFDSNQVRIIEVADGAAALTAAKRNTPDYALAYFRLADSSGVKVIQSLKRRYPLMLGAVFGPRISLEERGSLISEGADDYIETDSDTERVETSVRRLIARRETGILGRNEKILQVIEIVEEIAPTKVTVLITGESGTGKELIARAIHLRSDRRDGPFVAVNCAALPQGVLESELFGHEKGAFTGASAQRKGRFEVADGGTLLLDEVGEMPLGTQVKLLRVLEEERFMRVGGSRDVNVDVRVIASTNSDLKRQVEESRFRRDLYYRLNVVPVHAPPLRERRDDIEAIFLGCIEQARLANKVDFGGISREALHALEAYYWPGNVRELKNLAANLLVLSGGRRIGIEDLPDHIVRPDEMHRELPVRAGRPRSEIERDLLFGRLAEIEHRVNQLTELVLEVRNAVIENPDAQRTGRPVPGAARYEEIKPGDDIVVRPGASMKEVERDLIERTLKEVGGNRKKAARHLGIGERTLYRRMKEYGLS
jgi:DNA-binding NtrC family response regulator